MGVNTLVNRDQFSVASRTNSEVIGRRRGHCIAGGGQGKVQVNSLGNVPAKQGRLYSYVHGPCAALRAGFSLSDGWDYL